MIVYHPPLNAPELISKQVQRLKEALGALERQADQEEIRLRSLTSVNDIGRHILEREAA